MKLNRMEKTMADYEINSWPTIIVDGRLMIHQRWLSQPSHHAQRKKSKIVLVAGLGLVGRQGTERARRQIISFHQKTKAGVQDLIRLLFVHEK